MLRRVIIGGIVAALFIGCLFPSFDDLKNNDLSRPNPTDDDDSDASKSDANGSTTSGTTSGQTSTSSGVIADTGADTAPPKSASIDCNGKICNAETQICCDDGFNNTSCKPKNGSCSLWLFECDDSTDCPTGQQCCHGNAGLEVRCQASCSGTEICQPGKPCKSGACGGELTGPPAVTVHECN